MKTTRLILYIFFIAILAVMPACKKERPKTVAAQSKNNAPEIPEFTMNDMEGASISLTDEIKKNDLTIIDFWASWCGPCMQEAPNMVALYEQYHDKGLGIIGISLDKDAQAWKQAVADKNMTWTQVSELNGWNNSVAQFFKVEYIPFTIIVDKEGHIVGGALTGNDLRVFIADRLK